MQRATSLVNDQFYLTNELQYWKSVFDTIVPVPLTEWSCTPSTPVLRSMYDTEVE